MLVVEAALLTLQGFYALLVYFSLILGTLFSYSESVFEEEIAGINSMERISYQLRTRSQVRPQEVCEPPAKKRRMGTHTVSLCESQNITTDLGELRRLEIAPSHVPAPQGAGSEAFTTSNTKFCKPGKKIIFNKEDIIIRKVNGTAAYRLHLEKANKWLEWIHYDKLIMPLTEDSNVLWSGYFLKSTEIIEVGILPDGIAININDSPTPNCEVRTIIEDKT